MSATAPRLDVDQIAVELDRIRKSAIDTTRRAFPRLAREDLENAYGDLCEEALTTSFESVEQLEAWVNRALRRDAIDILRSARVRRETCLGVDVEQLAARETVEDATYGREARGLLHEFLADLPAQERLIAYLHLDPDWDWKPKRIATATGIPVSEVRLSVDRNGSRLRRFVVQDLAGKRCASLARERLVWIDTGELSLRLRLHLRRCPTCRAELRAGRQSVRHALLPLLPPASIPFAAGGWLARVHEAAITHPLAIRAQDGLHRWRKLAPVGGGGTAAVAAKLAAAGAIVTATATLHVIAHGSPRPHHIHPTASVHHLAIHRLPVTATTPVTMAPITMTPAQNGTATHTTPARATAGRTSAKASPTYSPPPLANPLPTTKRQSAGIEQTDERSNASTSTGGSGQSKQNRAYAPAPIQSGPAAPPRHHSSQDSSSVPGPSGPPAP